MHFCMRFRWCGVNSICFKESPFLCLYKCNLLLYLLQFCWFSALLRKQHTAELHLGDFLVFLRRVVSSKAIQSKMASPKWTEVLLNIAAQKCCSGTRSYYRVWCFLKYKHKWKWRFLWLLNVGVPLVGNLRTRLLALHVLEAVLPACETSMEDDQMTQVLIVSLCKSSVCPTWLSSVRQL